MINKILGVCLSVSFLSLSFTDASFQVASQDDTYLAGCPCRDRKDVKDKERQEKSLLA